MVTEERVEEVTIRLSGGDGGGSADNNDNVHFSNIKHHSFSKC